ncbi:hypothetical protein [Spirillospora sp. CA-294931]|uniref:hypothetical protein n=1 Tax=Spirillospora sp. CA-294931 TaxID=3240042 RepID=UPI003D8F00D4
MSPDRAAHAGALLLALTAIPAVALVLPDTSLNVMEPARASLGLQDEQIPGLLRAAGLTLPALLLTVPLAAVTARRFSPRLVLLAGLLFLVAGIGAARYAGTVPLVAAARVAQGVGAGVVLPATLVLVWERGSRVLTAVWAGALVAALMFAMPLALHEVPLGGSDWHAALAPFPWPALAAVGAALLCAAVRTRDSLPSLRANERGQLVLPAVPAAGFAFLAVVTTFEWSPGAQLVVAASALLALIGLALVGSRDAAAGSPLGCAMVMITAGLLTYPMTGPLAGLASAGDRLDGGAATLSLLLPFGAGAAAAMAGALVTARMSLRAARGTVLAGHGLVIVAVLLALAVGASSGPWLLMAPLIPLGAGVGTALAASLRDAGAAAALFGLSLCFPAVLTGQLLVLSLQAGQWHRTRPDTASQQLYALTAGYRVWLVAAGVVVVLLAAACRRIGAVVAREAAA